MGKTAGFALAVLLGLAALPGGFAEDIRIAAPYIGAITNGYEDPEGRFDLEDTGLLTGLYFQWIDPARYQWNAFVYYSPDVNHSTVWGGHFIYDYYFAEDRYGPYLLGAGIEIIRIDMDAGGDIPPLTNFTLENTLTIPYLRAGKYFRFGMGHMGVSFLPWVGIQPEIVAGTLKYGLPFPPFGGEESLNDTEWYGIAGINVKFNLFRFLDVEGKYQGTFGSGEYRPTISAVVNLFVSRRWGLSYRFKYMETSSGSDSYHLAGVAVVF